MIFKLLAHPSCKMTHEDFKRELARTMTNQSTKEGSLFVKLLELGYRDFKPLAYGTSCYVGQAQDRSGKPIIIKIRHFPDIRKYEENADPMLPMRRTFLAKIKAKALAEHAIMELRDNPFIVTPKDFLFRDNYVCFVYPMIQGPSLAAVLAACSNHPSGIELTEPIVLKIGAELVHALSVMHHAGYVYRNLDPQHILFDSDGHLNLIGLGTTKKIVSRRGMIKTSSYEALGTDCPAPEIATNAMSASQQATYGFSVDLWNLGVTIAKLCLDDSRLAGSSTKIKAFIRLLKSDRRLELDEVGAEALKSQPVFKGIDWETIASRTGPTILPQNTYSSGMETCSLNRMRQQVELQRLEFFKTTRVPHQVRRGPHRDAVKSMGKTITEFNPDPQ